MKSWKSKSSWVSHFQRGTSSRYAMKEDGGQPGFALSNGTTTVGNTATTAISLVVETGTAYVVFLLL